MEPTDKQWDGGEKQTEGSGDEGGEESDRLEVGERKEW